MTLSAQGKPPWPMTQPAPRHGDTIECGPLRIKVGAHNGDFRYILVEDHLGRPIADGSVPYSALAQIEEASHAPS